MDEITREIREIKESQIRMEVDIKYHIRRTDLLESRLDRELTPVYRTFIASSWIIGALTTVAGLILALDKLIHLS